MRLLLTRRSRRRFDAGPRTSASRDLMLNSDFNIAAIGTLLLMPLLAIGSCSASSERTNAMTHSASTSVRSSFSCPPRRMAARSIGRWGSSASAFWRSLSIAARKRRKPLLHCNRPPELLPTRSRSQSTSISHLIAMTGWSRDSGYEEAAHSANCRRACVPLRLEGLTIAPTAAFNARARHRSTQSATSPSGRGQVISTSKDLLASRAMTFPLWC